MYIYISGLKPNKKFLDFQADGKEDCYEDRFEL